MTKTDSQIEVVVARCRDIFKKKMEDYGTSWSIMRPESLTDQIFIKARRVRTLETIGQDKAAIAEGREPEFIGIINYAAMALTQLKREEYEILPCGEALELYDAAVKSATSLLRNKNHDYDEAWREMRISSFTDIILQKIHRTKEIEDNGGKTLVSEGIDANYQDIINYAIFALIKLSE